MKMLKTIYQNVVDIIMSKIFLIAVNSVYYATHAFVTKHNKVNYTIVAGQSNSELFPYMVFHKNSLGYENLIKCEDKLDAQSKFHFEVAKLQRMLDLEIAEVE